MYVKTIYGPVWISETAPYFRDWKGRAAYTYLLTQARAAQDDGPLTPSGSRGRDQSH